MKSPNTLPKRRLAIVTIAEFAFSPVLIISFVLSPIHIKSAAHTASPTASYIQEAVKQEKVDYKLPVRLKIPKISVDAALDYVGLTAQGALDSPKGPANAAWFNQGPRPGETGDSVIDGHFGWKDNIPAVFDNLHKLQKGDNLYIEDEKGATITFAVREFRTFGPNEDATSIFRSNDGKAHLNLITCQGIWNKTQKSYSTRLVVFADKEM